METPPLQHETGDVIVIIKENKPGKSTELKIDIILLFWEHSMEQSISQKN